jgi:predicted regulator of Ras-like GTPase activity (Roadblock/LC7/MglB family)
MDFEETKEPAKGGTVKALSEQLVNDPNSLVFASLADIYREEGMIEEALAMCQAGLALHPRHIPGQLVLAKIHRDTHRPLEALEALEKVLALDPGNPEARALLESLDSKLEEPSPLVSSGGPSSEPASEIVSEIQAAVQALNSGTGIEDIPGPGVPALKAPQAGGEGLKIVPWGDAASAQGVPTTSSEGWTAKATIPEIERSTLGFVPGAVNQDSWVISRPIEMDFPVKVPSLNPPSSRASERSPYVSPVTTEEMNSPLFKESAELVPQKEFPVIGTQVPLQELPQALPTRPDEQPGAGPPTIPLEGSLSAAPKALPVAPRVKEQPGQPREEVSLTEFMKTLSSMEFMEPPSAPVAERAAAEPEVFPAPSDEQRGEMETALDDLLTLDEVEGAMIVNRDGLVLAERTRAWINAEETAALAASIYETTLRSIGRMEMGQLDRGIVETALGQLYFIALGDHLLVLLTRDDTKMGLVLMRMKKVMDRVRRVLG